MALCLFRRPLTDEEKPVQIVFLWTRVYVLFSVNQIIGRELVPFEKWYQEAKFVHSAEVHDSVFIAMPYQIWSAKYGIKMKFFHQSIAYSIRFLDIIYSNVRNALYFGQIMVLLASESSKRKAIMTEVTTSTE